MTEKEAIERIRKEICNGEGCDDGCLYGDENCPYSKAMSALVEIQQYRGIGTAEEIKDLLAVISEAEEDTDEEGISVGYIKALVELAEYRKIGTVEDFRAAVEKQEPMTIEEIHVDEYFCPCCGSENGCDQKRVGDKFCPNCGQRIEVDG